MALGGNSFPLRRPVALSPDSTSRRICSPDAALKRMLCRPTHAVKLLWSDLTQFSPFRTFKLAIVPFRPVQHLTTICEQLNFLRCVREHLEPGGRLVFDVFNLTLGLLSSEIIPEELVDTPELRLTDGR